VVDLHLISARQRKIWDALNDSATVVVGKKPLVSEVEPRVRARLNITLSATNIGFTATGKAIVADVVPAGFGLVEGSFAPAPTRVISLLDGGKRIEWEFPFPAGIPKTDPKGNPYADQDPTKYFTQFFTYTLVVPELDFGARYFLPSAIADSEADGEFESRSAQTLLESVEVIELPAEYDFPPYPWWLFVAMVGGTLALALVIREARIREMQRALVHPLAQPTQRATARAPPPLPPPGKGIEPPPAALLSRSPSASAVKNAAARGAGRRAPRESDIDPNRKY
jgi:hypothetical protein